MQRCSWCESHPLLRAYHDEEWGLRPCFDRKHFEFLTLEAAQAGLSWMAVLTRRENYRKAFGDFDPETIAAFGDRELSLMLADPGLIRNRQKLLAAINNARAFLKVCGEFGSFDEYLLSFTGGSPIINAWTAEAEIPAVTELAQWISADMKARGFKFMGPTVVYAHLQASGIVDDHLLSCFRKPPAAQGRSVDLHKAQVLTLVCQALEKAGVRFAVGGSALLFRHGLAPDYHDLDLTADLKDMEKAVQALCALGQRIDKPGAPGFATQFFGSWIIQDVPVDVMAGLIILQGGQAYRYMFEQAPLQRLPVNGVFVPYAPLADWQTLYRLMGREEKAWRIAAFRNLEDDFSRMEALKGACL